jgi:hypothetical protein
MKTLLSIAFLSCTMLVSKAQNSKKFKGTIISVDAVNSIAVAKLHVKMYDFEYDEFISFHKFDNHWLIVNKMITDIGK